MNVPPRSVVPSLLALRTACRTADRFSTNNGTILLVLAITFQVDMLLFECGYHLHTQILPLIALSVVNGGVLIWWILYASSRPIRPLRALTNRVVFWWSWYYVALVGLGVGVWAICIGPYPPGWLGAIGFVGALPLAISGYRMRRHWRVV